jgi:hypothetical protein
MKCLRFPYLAILYITKSLKENVCGKLFEFNLNQEIYEKYQFIYSK